jgi:hypothetical protein
MAETDLLKQVKPSKGGKPAKAGPKKGVKSKNWDEDPDILARLEAVSQMMLKGAKLWQIAKVLSYSITTAKKDKGRVKELWLREATSDVIEARDRSIAQMRLVQREAWQRFGKRSKNPQWLRVVKDCERDIIALQGTEKPVPQTLILENDEDRPYKDLSDEEFADLLTSLRAKKTITGD